MHPGNGKLQMTLFLEDVNGNPFSTVSRDLVLVAMSPSLPSLKDMESNGKSEE